MNKKRVSIFVILVTFTLSWLSAAIIFPIMAPLFLGKADTIIRAEIPENIRAILFGVFLASFPLAQFLFSPVIGEYSDRWGRKKAFYITLVLEGVGYILSAVGIQYHHLSLLFFGRFITGLGAGNLSVCLASLADFSANEKSRIQYFSYGSAISGIMFVVGPFIGGRLAEVSFAFPLWIGAILAVVNILLIWIFFKEILEKKEDLVVDPIKAIHDVQNVFQTKAIKSLYLVFFFFLFAWNMLYLFLPAILVEEFSGTSTLIGDLSAVMGIIWFAGTLVVSFIAHYTKRYKWTGFVALSCFAILVITISYPNTLREFIFVTSAAVFFAGGVWPIVMGTISKITDSGSQGKILGISQSVQSLSMMLAPFLGGFFFQAHSGIPFFIAAASALLAAFLLLPIKKM